MMALEERRIAREEIPIHQRIKGDDIPTDQFSDPFPVGMRVLAVDDDATCLRVLEGKLRTCQYHVTTATHALTALKMLRENKDNFDIVISDVEMPDMDGFKLLELVGLEMDLPVIMLSAHSDTKSVMKGVTHGACDYLLKPVRVEELKNIWQHVIRKKFDAKDSNNSENSEKPRQGTFEGGQGSASGQTDQNGKFNRKRKDQYDDDDEEEESGDGQENEDPSAQKKPRVVWSVDLHRKFVSAVNQLGVDKAVPKKILDLMNVDKLTRENVASHLQKYRLYMKRLSSVANHQANMMASLAGKDPSYLRMSSFDGLGDFHALTTAAALPNAIGSYPPGAMLGRLSTPAALAFNGISAGMVQPGHAPIPNNSLSDLGKLQSISLPGNQSGNLLNGMPIAMELDQLQHNKSASHIVDFSTAIDDSSLYPLAASFQNPGIFEAGVGVASQVLDHGRSNENWQGSGSLTGFSSNSLPSSDPFPQVNFPRINVTAQFSPITSRIRCNQHDISSTSALRDAQHQSSSAVFGMQQETLKQPNFGSTSNRVGHTVNYSMQLNQANSVAFSALQDNLKSTNFGSASNRGALNSSNSAPAINEGLCPLGQNFGKDKAVSSRRDPALINQSDSVTPFMQQSRFEKLPLGASVGSKGGHHMDQTKIQSGFVTNSSGTLEDLMNAMVKQEHGELLMDEGIGCSSYSVRTCI